jgi:hypothetical protein
MYASGPIASPGTEVDERASVTASGDALYALSDAEVGAINGTHPACAEHGLDPIPPQGGANHVCGCMPL